MSILYFFLPLSLCFVGICLMLGPNESEIGMVTSVDDGNGCDILYIVDNVTYTKTMFDCNGLLVGDYVMMCRNGFMPHVAAFECLGTFDAGLAMFVLSIVSSIVMTWIHLAIAHHQDEQQRILVMSLYPRLQEVVIANNNDIELGRDERGRFVVVYGPK